MDKIFLSNALGKQMSKAEIQIVFANGYAVAKECINCYSLGGKFLSFTGDGAGTLGIAVLLNCYFLVCVLVPFFLGRELTLV